MNPNERQSLIEKLAQNDVDSLDLEGMMEFVYNNCADHYQRMSDEELMDIAKEYLNIDEE